MLARVDGKSPVEYLVGHPGGERARRFGRTWLAQPAGSLTSLLDAFAP
jgi:hypothetical protein